MYTLDKMEEEQMEKELFKAYGAPEKLKNRITVVSSIFFIVGVLIGGVMVCIADDRYTRNFWTRALIISAIVVFVLQMIKKHLNQVVLKIYKDHIEGTHCGILHNKSFYFECEQIDSVQYNLNEVLSGISIITLNVKYNFLIDNGEEACNIIRNLINGKKDN